MFYDFNSDDFVAGFMILLGTGYGMFKELFWVKIGFTIATHNVLWHAIAWKPRYCVVWLQNCSSRVHNCMGFGAIA